VLAEGAFKPGIWHRRVVASEDRTDGARERVRNDIGNVSARRLSRNTRAVDGVALCPSGLEVVRRS